jgi:HK97 family phage portal protein
VNYIQKVIGKIAIKALGFNNSIPLTEQDRQTLQSLFGSWIPLNFENNSNAQINDGYLKNVDVFSIVKKIVDISKSIPWIIEQQDSQGAWIELRNTSLHELLDEPNLLKGYTWNDIEEMSLLYLLITGNTYLSGGTRLNSQLIESLEVLPSNCINIYNMNQDFFNPEIIYQFSLGASQRTYTEKEIKHIRFYNPNVQRFNYGLSPIQVAANVVQVGNERWTADASILGNRAVVGLLSDESNVPLLPDEVKVIDDKLRNRFGGARKFGQIITTNKALKYIPIGLSPSDLQLLEKGVVTTRTLCNVLGLDSSLFNDPANKTFNNRVEAEKAMFTNCIIPLSDKMSESYSSYLCSNHFPGKRVRMRQDFSKVECLQENLKEKSTILADLKIKGIYTANEVRLKLGEEISTDENADKLIISTTLASEIGATSSQS